MLFVITGGTIDKQPVYLPDGKTFDNDSKVFEDTHLPAMLAQARYVGEYTVKQLFMVDSLDMTDTHREQIAAAIAASDERHIVVTHGTDTMPETARHLKAYRELGAKTIVLTGAMVPYSVESSDALYNLGTAMAYAESQPNGVYIAMNGRVFEADNVRKDVEAGLFRTLE